MIRKRRGKWVLISRKTGKPIGIHATEKEAQAQETAINISKARKAGANIPKK